MNRKERRTQEARAQQQLANNPFVVMFNEALALHQAGRLPEAETLYRKAMTLNPNIPLLYNNFGVCLYAQDKDDEAIES